MPLPVTPSPVPDYAAFRYPSDRLTLADLRRAHPDRFDPTGGDLFEAVEDDPAFGLSEALYLERMLAGAAFERAVGRHGPDTRAAEQMTRDGCLDTLTSVYQQYGLAAGRHQTEQLVRDIETQAAAQAGRGR